MVLNIKPSEAPHFTRSQSQGCPSPSCLAGPSVSTLLQCLHCCSSNFLCPCPPHRLALDVLWGYLDSHTACFSIQSFVQLFLPNSSLLCFVFVPSTFPITSQNAPPHMHARVCTHVLMSFSPYFIDCLHCLQ